MQWQGAIFLLNCIIVPVVMGGHEAKSQLCTYICLHLFLFWFFCSNVLDILGSLEVHKLWQFGERKTCPCITFCERASNLNFRPRKYQYVLYQKTHPNISSFHRFFLYIHEKGNSLFYWYIPFIYQLIVVIVRHSAEGQLCVFIENGPFIQNGPIQQENMYKHFGSKLFRPKAYPAKTFSNRAYPAYASSKLCEFI